MNVDISDFEFALIRVNPASSVPATLAMKQALPPFLKGHLQESVEDIMRALCAEFRPNWVCSHVFLPALRNSRSRYHHHAGDAF